MLAPEMVLSVRPAARRAAQAQARPAVWQARREPQAAPVQGVRPAEVAEPWAVLGVVEERRVVPVASLEPEESVAALERREVWAVSVEPQVAPVERAEGARAAAELEVSAGLLEPEEPVAAPEAIWSSSFGSTQASRYRPWQPLGTAAAAGRC